MYFSHCKTNLVHTKKSKKKIKNRERNDVNAFERFENAKVSQGKANVLQRNTMFLEGTQILVTIYFKVT